MPAVFLADRALLRVTGADAEASRFLNALITADLAALVPGEALGAALLTPQGKILFDFLVSGSADDLWLECCATERDALLRRLMLYRLRAPVQIKSEGESGVTVVWESPRPPGAALDRRFSPAGVTLWRRPGRLETAGDDREALDTYGRLRIISGVAEAVVDYPPQDAFPHDVLLDRNGGVSFKKGCYIGQEVVSRMQHRKTARRRLVIVEAEAAAGTMTAVTADRTQPKTALPPMGTVLTAGGRPLGTLGSVCGAEALAIVRIDRVGAALDGDQPILAGDVPVRLRLPVWSDLAFPQGAASAGGVEDDPDG